MSYQKCRQKCINTKLLKKKKKKLRAILSMFRLPQLKTHFASMKTNSKRNGIKFDFYKLIVKDWLGILLFCCCIYNI